MSTARAYPGIVRALKDKKESLGLSNQSMLDVITQAGKIASKSAADRIFAPDGEERHFIYEDTLQPFVEVFLSDRPTEDNEIVNIIAAKDETIEQLRISVRDKRRAIWFLTFGVIFLVLFILAYIAFYDLPNLEYGIFR